jgi:hypothetical protein
VTVDLLLSTHDTGYERPDGPAIAKVLASLDGGLNTVATLGGSDSAYLQAVGSVRTGFGLDLQEGSLDRRYRTRDRALPLAWVTEAFQRYARGDLSWRDDVEWEDARIAVPKASWTNSWAVYIGLLGAAAAAVWAWHAWRAAP